MRTTLLAARMLVRIGGLIQIVLGILIWLGIGVVLQLHMAVGAIFVLGLWIVGIIGLFVLDHRSTPLLVLILGGIILWFGMGQTTMLTGSLHWIVRVLHLLLGIAGIGMGERLAAAVNRHRGWGDRGRNTEAAGS
jgi:hypothetical protein